MYQDVSDFTLLFLSIFWEAMPFVVLGALIAGLLEELLPQDLISKIMPRSPLPAVIVGGLLGLVFPMCECGIVVVMRRLLRKGLPLSSCVSYMLAGPIVNVVVLMSTAAAFEPHNIGAEMVLLRAGLGFLIACVTGLVVHAQERSVGIHALLKDSAAPPKIKSLSLLEPELTPAKGGLVARLGRISETALHDVMDIATFLLLGSILAAFVRLAVSGDDVASFSRDTPFLAIPAMMVLAVVLCLCSEADAFVAASFTELSVSAKLAFLVLGPMLDLKLLFMYTRVFKPRLILTLVVCTTVQVLVSTMIVHQLYDPAPGNVRATSVPAATATAKP